MKDRRERLAEVKRKASRHRDSRVADVRCSKGNTVAEDDCRPCLGYTQRLRMGRLVERWRLGDARDV